MISRDEFDFGDLALERRDCCAELVHSSRVNAARICEFEIPT